MHPKFCHIFLAFVLKVLNFIQTFFGVAIIIYSIWMLEQWHHRIPDLPPSAPSPDSSSSLSLKINRFNFTVSSISGFRNELAFNKIKLPAPWFIYSFMGVGIILCFTSLIGCIAAEAINSFCLCFYAVLETSLIVIEAILVAFISIDHCWERAFPYDPTGDLESIKMFIKENAGMCKWVGITAVVIQAMSLLLGIILRAICNHRHSIDCEDDDCENGRGRAWEPLLNPCSTNADARGTHSEIWSSRIREKYGLGSGDKN